MRLNIKVIPNAKENKIVEEQGRIKVWLTSVAVEGRGNTALIKFLSERYYVAKNKIRIVTGLKSRTKLVEIRK